MDNLVSMYNEEANTYWSLLKHLSDGVKLRLIALLSESVSAKYESQKSIKSMEENRTNSFLAEFYGSWSGELSADDIVKMIHDSRTSKDPISLD